MRRQSRAKVFSEAKSINQLASASRAFHTHELLMSWSDYERARERSEGPGLLDDRLALKLACFG